MTRINYLLSWSERHTGIALPAFAPALRVPLGVFACAVTLVFVLWAVQHARLASLESRGADDARRLAAAEVDLGRVRAVERDVARFHLLGERIDAIRHSGPLHAGEIAALGDRLPAGAWLTSLHADRAALALEGRAARIEAVAAAVAALTELPSYSGAHLLSVREDPAGRGVSYALALEARR
jgi:Tfp pilus assembly protein PilN